jgi:hypothetical protein
VSLKELESWIERGQNVPFLRETRPRKKCTPNIGADIGAITGILLSIHTQTMTYCIRITDTASIGAVVPPDWFGGIALGLSLYPTEGYCLRVYSSSTLSMLKFPMFFFKIFFFTGCFLLVNLLVKIYRVSRKISYNRNPVNSSPAIMPLAALYFGVLFFRGHISLKNRINCPLFSHNSTSFKNMWLLI